MSAGKKQKKAAGRAASTTVMPPPSSRRPLWPWLLAAAIVAIAVFEIYGAAMNGPFLLDDTALLYDSPNPPPALSAWISGVRPLLMFTYWLNFRSAGQDTYAYHATNVLLHLLNGALVWLIVRRLLARFETEPWRLNTFSSFAALLFLLHPLNTESVAYIASRSETLSVFFFSLAFTIFLYRRTEAIRWPAAISVLLAFGAACLSKEHTVVLGALLILTDSWWNRGFSFAGVRRNWRMYVPMLAAGALAGLFVLRVLAGASTAGFHMKGLAWYDYFFTECRAIWVYLFLYVIPAGQNIDHDFAISHGILDHGALIGLVGLIAAIAAAWIFRRRFPLASYGFLTFLLLIAPTSSFVPIADPLVERRVYLPFIGLLLVTVDLLRRWRASKPALVGVLGAILVIESALTWQRNQLWADDLAMWRDSTAKSPAKVRPRFQLARLLYGRDRCAEAAGEFAKAASLAPPDYPLLIDWGLAEDCAQHPDAAIEKIRQALQLERNAHGYTQLAMVYAKRGRYDEALSALDTAARINPGYDMIYYYRGGILASQGNLTGAAAEYRHGLALNPQNTVIRDALDQLAHAAPAGR